MTALLVVETVLLGLLTLLVAGLLRSHAEILRRLNEASAPEGGTGGEGGAGRSSGAQRWRDEGERHPDWLPRPRDTATPAHDIVGRTLSGEAIHIGVRRSRSNTLLAFLSSGCTTCLSFWDAFRGDPSIPGGARLVIVTKDPTHESPSKLRTLAPGGVPLVMSTAAWDDYAVPLSPYFIYVEGPTGEVAGEGSAGHWAQVESLLSDALADAGPAAGAEDLQTSQAVPASVGGARRADTAGRLARMDAELGAAGIGPGHPSLYAGDHPPREGDAGGGTGGH